MDAKKNDALFSAALRARDHAYAPYSGFKVGAALLTREGRIFAGCNVENSTYGATCCAEQVAVHNAVAELGKLDIAEVLVVTDNTPPWPPCGRIWNKAPPPAKCACRATTRCRARHRPMAIQCWTI